MPNNSSNFLHCYRWISQIILLSVIVTKWYSRLFFLLLNVFLASNYSTLSSFFHHMRNSFKEIPHIFVSNYIPHCQENSSISEVEHLQQKNESLISAGKDFFLCHLFYIVFYFKHLLLWLLVLYCCIIFINYISFFVRCSCYSIIYLKLRMRIVELGVILNVVDYQIWFQVSYQIRDRPVHFC